MEVVALRLRTAHPQNMQPIYTSTEIRQIESAALTNGATDLMERAGLAAAELARKLLPGGATKILVLAGPGNNGGDAFVVARYLLQWWFKVDVVFFGEEKKLPSDASDAYKKFIAAGGKTLDQLPQLIDHDLVIDGIFGLGLSRDVSIEHIKLFSIINELHKIVLSLDIPSGIDADTGDIRGAAIRATHTISFIALKPGLLTNDGPDYVGEYHVADLQLDAKNLYEPRGYLIDQNTVACFLKPRARNSHKGTYGSVGVIGGTQGMAGAALLAARAALKLGAGKVFVGMLAEGVVQLDVAHPELMWRTPEELLRLEELAALAIGCGMGGGNFEHILLQRALPLNLPLVIDADGLNLLASDESLEHALKSRTAPSIITPHPAEAARLLKINTKEIQQNRVAAANQLAKRYNAFVVLKGCGSICAAPDGRWFINPSGNPGMASAGMGDVLSGMIAALLAQGLDAEQAILLGVYLHGTAADACVKNGVGPIGLTASEVMDSARLLLNDWIY
jgi:ADP-dependent NAD(P)H-hydrate dehydratase / NAD(P)H-hydrate epimerase